MKDIWNEYEGLHDVFLEMVCESVPHVDDLVQDIPEVASADFVSRITGYSHVPGELGLELPKELALELLKRFEEAGSEGYCFPAIYHHPRVTLEQAERIATEVIEKRRQERVPTDTLGPLFLYAENPLCWILGAGSPQLMNEGLIPGAFLPISIN